MNSLYITTYCPSCKPIVAAIQQRGIDVAVKNVDLNQDWKVELFRTGSQAVPTAVIDGRVYIGGDVWPAIQQTYGL